MPHPSPCSGASQGASWYSHHELVVFVSAFLFLIPAPTIRKSNKIKIKEIVVIVLFSWFVTELLLFY